jgi:hypothetical protein
MRFERRFQSITDRLRQCEIDEREEVERRRLESRSLWEKIRDLPIDDDLRSVLWELLEKIEPDQVG